MTTENLKWTSSTGNHAATLTTEHSQSKHGDPVLILDGAAYGPCDVIESLGMTAEEFVTNASSSGHSALVKRFFAAIPPDWSRFGLTM